MKILTTQNKQEEKFLRNPTKPFDFTKFTKKEIKDLIENMRTEMRKANGVGLSANQVGFDFSMFVAELPDERGAKKFYAIFNPKLEKISDETLELEEGCLSVPGIYGKIKRSDKVLLTGFDKNNKKIKIKAWGFLAQIFQHEVGHLSGKLFIDKAKDLHSA